MSISSDDDMRERVHAAPCNTQMCGNVARFVVSASHGDLCGPSVARDRAPIMAQRIDEGQGVAQQLSHPYDSVIGQLVVQGDIVGVRKHADDIFSAHVPLPAGSNGLRWICSGLYRSVEEAAAARDLAALGTLPLPCGERRRWNNPTNSYCQEDVVSMMRSLRSRYPQLITNQHVDDAAGLAEAAGASARSMQPCYDNGNDDVVAACTSRAVRSIPVSSGQEVSPLTCA